MTPQGYPLMLSDAGLTHYLLKELSLHLMAQEMQVVPFLPKSWFSSIFRQKSCFLEVFCFLGLFEGFTPHQKDHLH